MGVQGQFDFGMTSFSNRYESLCWQSTYVSIVVLGAIQKPYNLVNLSLFNPKSFKDTGHYW